MYAGFLVEILPEDDTVQRWGWFIFSDDGRILEGLFPTLKATYARMNELQRNPSLLCQAVLEEPLERAYRYRNYPEWEDEPENGTILEGPFFYETDGSFYDLREQGVQR